MGVEKYICSEDYTNLLQFFSGFLAGALFGPISMGLTYFIIWIALYEIILFWATRKLKKSYQVEARILINVGALIGWLVSRKLFNSKILN